MLGPSFIMEKVRVLVREASPADGPTHDVEDGVPSTSLHRRLSCRYVSSRSFVGDGALRTGEE